MQNARAAFGAACLSLGCAFVSPAAMADMTGQAVYGTLAFGPHGEYGGHYWDTTRIVGDDVEFVYAQHDPEESGDSADFIGDTLRIGSFISGGAGAYLNGFRMTFATPGGFTKLDLVSDAFFPELSYRLEQGTIVVDWEGGPTATGPQAFNAVFAVSAVPEVSTWGLTMAGLAGLGAFSLRRRRQGGASVR